jgi:DNA-binding IclR family transcriptional regulator
MARDEFPAELQRFIASEFRSLEHLEVLLLLRSGPDRDWDERAVYDVLRSSLASVHERLTELYEAGYIDQTPSGLYRYDPASPELAQKVAEVAEAYKTRRSSVTEAIYGRGNTAASDLARAFEIRRKKR